jgi:hypothetical protein
MAFQTYDFTPTATDLNGDTLTFSIVNKPGWADFDTATGRLSGTVLPAFIGGSDEVQIKVSDGLKTTALAPFTITVANQPPELFPADQPGPELTATQGVEYEYWPDVIDRDGESLYFSTLESLPRWLSLNSVTGRLVGTPGPTDVGAHHIRISVTDLRDTVLVADYILNVGNGAPVVGSDPPLSVDVGHPYDYLPVVSDPEGNPLSFELFNRPDWLSVDPATGQLSGTPTQADLGLWELLDLCASDGLATTCGGEFSIEVRNQAPTIAGTPAATIEVGQSYGFTPTAGDNNADALTFSVINLPEWASFDPADGTVSGEPAEIDIRLWTAVEISVSDGIETTALAAFDIEVLPDPAVPLNTPPSIGGSPQMHVRVGAAYGFTPVATDADGDTLTFEIDNLPVWAAFDTDTGALTGTPTPADADSLFADILITVTDGVDSVSLPAFDIQVETGNRAPSIDGVPDTRVEIGSAYSFVPSAQDEDGDVLGFEIDNQPSWAGFDPDTGALTGTPAVGDEGLYADIVIRVHDGTVGTALPAFSILVETPSTPNQAPSIAGTPATAARVGHAYGFTPSASDPELDPLSFSVVNLPAWADFDEQSGTLSGTPELGDVGDYAGIQISVSDGELEASLPSFAITVAENHAPVIDGNPPSSTNVGQLYSFTPTASDPDGDTLTYEVKNQPGWADFDPASGTLSGIPGQGDVKVWRYIKIGASDGQITSWFGNFTIPVRNQPPSVTGEASVDVAIGESYSFTPSITDRNGDPITEHLIQNLPAWADFDPASGTLSGTPGLADVGKFGGIKIGANDGLATGWSGAFAITVTNQAPVLEGALPGSVQVGQEYRFTPSAAYDPDGHALSFSITALSNNLPDWLTLDPATGSLIGTPTRAALDAQPYWYFKLSATDGYATTTLPAVHLNVANSAPSIEGTPAPRVDVGQRYSFTPSASDLNGDPLIFSVSNLPSWASFDPATGSLTGDPTDGDIQNWRNVKITVSDGLKSTSLANFDILVDAANSAPVITGNPAWLIQPGATYRFTPAVRDRDTDDVLSFSIENRPAWASFDPDTGTLTGTPGAADAGSYSADVLISVDDGEYTSSLDPFDIEVSAVPYDEVAEALASGDVRYVSDANHLIDAALEAISTHPPTDLDLEPIRVMLGHLRAGDYNFDWTDCDDDSPCEKVEGFAAEFLDGAKLVNQLLTRLDRTKVDLFARADLRLERLMLLLADYYRQDVRFPMLRNDGDQMAFLRSYYADLATYTHRPLNPAQPDPGNFGSADFRWVTPETVELDLISRKSFRAAGVYALPGETMTVTRLDAGQVTTKVFINTIRPNTGRIWSDGGYRRPNNLRSQSFEIAPGETLTLTSSIGGPVQVEYSSNDVPVRLRFEHVGRHPVWRGSADSTAFTQAVADSTAFTQAVADNTANPRGYNWAEIINHTFEIHTRLDKLNQTLGLWPDLDELSDTIVRLPHSQLRSLAGFVGDDIEGIPEVDAIVAANGWEHRVWDRVQHMNADQATCGAGCSGNPYDAGWAFNPQGHGDLHEIGHTVQDGGFKDWPNHAMTNWYSYGIKLQYFRDTGLTEGRGTWMCGKLTFNGLEPLFDIVQQSVHQADPFGYVYAQVRGLDYDDPDDEEAGDYPDASPVNDPLAQATYLSLLMFAERYGALQNGFHLRTLTHIYANSLALATKNDASWAEWQGALGMDHYSRDEARAVDINDRNLFGMSRATGLDYREPFAMFGLPVSAKAADQVAAWGLTPLPRELFVFSQAGETLCDSGLAKPTLPADGTQVWPLP